jgi:hypothetical protein
MHHFATVLYDRELNLTDILLQRESHLYYIPSSAKPSEEPFNDNVFGTMLIVDKLHVEEVASGMPKGRDMARKVTPPGRGRRQRRRRRREGVSGTLRVGWTMCFWGMWEVMCYEECRASL